MASALTFEIEKDFSFEAAHFFNHVDANDSFKKLHGHSFTGTVRIEGSAQEDKGWIRDLWKIETIIKEVIAPLDHALLNEIEGLEYPSLELIAAWIFERLEDRLPGLACVEVGRPTCNERARARRA
jgi:6-pyruvoyltetrahydropterin/6-carboxytetrahydropterin synthase